MQLDQPQTFEGLTIDHAWDESGDDRWFVKDKHGDWIDGPFDTKELALAGVAIYQEEKYL